VRLWEGADPAVHRCDHAEGRYVGSSLHEIADAMGATRQIIWDLSRLSGRLRRVLDTSRGWICLGFIARSLHDRFSGLKETYRRVQSRVVE
jgi:hypothetical protein